MHLFDNKVAVITGAASGIGKALALKCLANNMNVALFDINQAELHKFPQLTHSKNLIKVVGNVANEADVMELANQTINQFGAIDFLFNNAGIAGSVLPIWQQSTEDIEQVIKVNLLGMIHTIKTFVPLMLQQDTKCFIINTSAGAGLITGAGLATYKASKHAITALSEVLLADLKMINSKINVSVLIPHWVNTDMPKSIQTDDPSIIDSYLEHLQTYGMSADLLADKVFAGIENNQFYIFSHFNVHAPKIEERMMNILSFSR